MNTVTRPVNQYSHAPASTAYPVERLELSHSTLAAFDSCPRKLEFPKLVGVNLRDRSKASDGGNALHIALGVYLTTKSKSKSTWALLENYPIDLCSNPMWSWSLEATYSALLSIFHFVDSHPELELATIDGKPAVEIAFEIEIDHKIPELMPVVYRGYIDFIFHNKIDDTFFVLDLKNTAAKIKDFTPMYRWDSQCLPYGLVLNHILNKPIENLEVKYLVVKVDVVNSFTTLIELEKSANDVQEWTMDLFMKLQTINRYIKLKWFPRNSKGCMAFSRTCRYYNICESRKISTMITMLQSQSDTSKDKDKHEFIPDVQIMMEIGNYEL